jgi:hypothetical protein
MEQAQALKGSCLCGAVAFEVSKPFLFFQYCHCSRCRKASGASHGANILVKAGQFAWTRGEAQVKRWELPEAECFCTGFCGVCGSSLPWVGRTGKTVIVPAGALDDDPGCKPERNIYWTSRAPWEAAVGDLKTFDEGAKR